VTNGDAALFAAVHESVYGTKGQNETDRKVRRGEYAAMQSRECAEGGGNAIAREKSTPPESDI